MMRALLAALIVANALVLAWSLDWLPFFSLPREREPERLQNQVRADAVQLITPTAASAALQAAALQRVPAPIAASGAVGAASAVVAAPSPDASATVCLEAGPFAAAEVAAAERPLRDLKLPNFEWTRQRSERGGSFGIYLGKFPDAAAATRRRDELRRQQIEVDDLRGAPEFEPGLSFGRYDTRAAADAALAQLVSRGVRNARVVVLNAPVVVVLLRVERADAALAQKLAPLSLPPAGSGFRPCALQN